MTLETDMTHAGVEHFDHTRGGEWTIAKSEDPKRLARMTYVKLNPEMIVIDHTLVPQTWSGQGLAKELLTAAVQYLRENKLVTNPTCPYAKKKLLENEQWHDVLDPKLKQL